MRWEGYSFRDQTISELAAIGSPSRPLFTVLLIVVYALMVAFGVGIRQVAGARRLRIVGALLIALGVMALTVGQFAAMRMRGTAQGLAGAIHLAEGLVAMLLVFSAMGIAASTLGARFRLYTIATIILALGFGAWSLAEAPRIEQGLPTPWVGVNHGSPCWLSDCCEERESRETSRTHFPVSLAIRRNPARKHR
jgi:hypothetical membrane protein